MNLQKRLNDAVDKHGVPGAAIAVWHGGELHEAASGVLNTRTGVLATPDSVFQVGSTTKVWTAALVMQLAEEGLVDLDETVVAYLPDFPVQGHITVRHLLTHTGGFDGDLFEDTGRGDDCLDRYLGFLKDAGHVHAPGELFSYCNAGYCVLGALVARLRGTTWEQALRDHLITPLGVTQAALFGEEAVLFRASAGHIGPDNQVYPQWQMPRSNAPAGSTFCLAPRELVRFGRMFLAGGVAEDGTRVLSEATVEAMLTTQVEVPIRHGMLGDRWGLGFELFDWGGYGHDGGTPGQSTFWRVVPGSDLSIALTVNGGGATGLIVELAVPLIEELTGLRLPAQPVPPASPGAFDASVYAGRYQGPQMAYEVSAAGAELEVALIPGELMKSMGQEGKVARYVHLADDTFVAVEAEEGRHETVSFVVRDGQAAYLHNSRALPRV
ncbi:serine hydrolase domain-containing protein [Nonomuraea sp. NPDC050663]|uniref:serine hydrolase domain-containing protein n=1 Tax=Nonomuraea sp. NPDC050663 TaxID=3364370 RepID=UPI0037AC3004